MPRAPRAPPPPAPLAASDAKRRAPPEGRPPVILGPRMMGYIQLGLLCLIIFLYVGFRIYYARKYGEWETDEE